MISHRRLTALLAGVGAALLLLAGRLFALQVIEGERYEDLSSRRHRRIEWTEPMRGAILDRGGVPLARDRVSYDLEIVLPDLALAGPRAALLANLEAAFRVAGSRVTRDRIEKALAEAEERILEEVEREAGRAPRRDGRPRRLPGWLLERIQGAPQPFLHDVEREAGLFIAANPERYPGLRLRTRYERVYADRPLVGPVTGSVGALGPREIDRLRSQGLYLPDLRQEYGRTFILTDPWYRERAYELSDRIGKSGIERAAEPRLRGKRGISIAEKVRRGGQELTTSMILYEEPAAGEPLRLSIDLEVQREAHAALGGHKGAAVAMDPATGEIWALVTGGPGEMNRAVRGTPPPASTVKIASAAGALEEGVIDPAWTVDCSGRYRAPGVDLGCWEPHGRVNLREALAHSCNVYFYEAAHRMKPKRRMSEWMGRFGFGALTGVELAAEELPGKLPPLEDYLTVIGQGKMTATPLQVARMAAVVANGGWLVRPTLLAGAEPDRVSVGLSPATLAAIREGLRAAVQGGTASGKGLESLSAAGKTGTAQVVKGRQGHSWFVGYAPEDRPRFVVCVFVEDDISGGGAVAAPIAARILRAALSRPTPGEGR